MKGVVRFIMVGIKDLLYLNMLRLGYKEYWW